VTTQTRFFGNLSQSGNARRIAKGFKEGLKTTRSYSVIAGASPAYNRRSDGDVALVSVQQISWLQRQFSRDLHHRHTAVDGIYIHNAHCPWNRSYSID
jgi:hypothetical protein